MQGAFTYMYICMYMYIHMYIYICATYIYIHIFIYMGMLRAVPIYFDVRFRAAGLRFRCWGSPHGQHKKSERVFHKGLGKGRLKVRGIGLGLLHETPKMQGQYFCDNDMSVVKLTCVGACCYPRTRTCPNWCNEELPGTCCATTTVSLPLHTTVLQ